jgi:hypothetical protein
MPPRFDLFRIEENGKLSWLGPMDSVAEAKKFVIRLAPSSKGFCVVDQETGEKTLIGPKNSKGLGRSDR